MFYLYLYEHYFTNLTICHYTAISNGSENKALLLAAAELANNLGILFKF